jgi:hypothetical protein
MDIYRKLDLGRWLPSHEAIRDVQEPLWELEERQARRRREQRRQREEEATGESLLGALLKAHTWRGRYQAMAGYLSMPPPPPGPKRMEAADSKEKGLTSSDDEQRKLMQSLMRTGFLCAVYMVPAGLLLSMLLAGLILSMRPQPVMQCRLVTAFIAGDAVALAMLAGSLGLMAFVRDEARHGLARVCALWLPALLATHAILVLIGLFALIGATKRGCNGAGAGTFFVVLIICVSPIALVVGCCRRRRSAVEVDEEDAELGNSERKVEERRAE